MARATRTLVAIVAFSCWLAASGAASPTDAQVVGAWTAHHEGFTFRLVLRPDKKLEWSVDSPDIVDDTPVTGTWRVEDRHLAVLWELRSDWAKIPILDVRSASLTLAYPLPNTRYKRTKLSSPPKPSNQAMQRTASKPAIYPSNVGHTRFSCVVRFPGLAVADLGSR